jgi:hypothetical protein
MPEYYSSSFYSDSQQMAGLVWMTITHALWAMRPASVKAVRLT